MRASCPSLERSEVLRQLLIPHPSFCRHRLAQAGGAVLAPGNAMIARINYPTPENPQRRAQQTQSAKGAEDQRLAQKLAQRSIRMKQNSLLMLPSVGILSHCNSITICELPDHAPTRWRVTDASVPVAATGWRLRLRQSPGTTRRRHDGRSAGDGQEIGTSRDRQEGRRVAIRRPCQSPASEDPRSNEGWQDEKLAVTWATHNRIDRLRVIANPGKVAAVEVSSVPLHTARPPRRESMQPQCKFSSAFTTGPRRPTRRWPAVAIGFGDARTSVARASARRTGYPIRRVFDRSMRHVRSPSQEEPPLGHRPPRRSADLYWVESSARSSLHAAISRSGSNNGARRAIV
jgi:hypothetical protein